GTTGSLFIDRRNAPAQDVDPLRVGARIGRGDEESRIARLVIGREPDHFAPVLKGQSDSLALENRLLRTGGDHEENRFDAIEWNVVQGAGARVERYVARHEIHVSKHPALHLSIEEVDDDAPLALHERAAEEVFAVSELRAHHD